MVGDTARTRHSLWHSFTSSPSSYRLLISVPSCWAEVAGLCVLRFIVRVYLGSGCFWARQHLIVDQLEQKALGRPDAAITAVAGYAGAAGRGDNGTACYHNPSNFSDYRQLGHAEVVQIEIPAHALVYAFSVYFGAFVELSPGVWDRPDYFDQGAEYRSLVGVAGGLANARVRAALNEANQHNMTLLPAYGSDPDTFGTNGVLIMDSDEFPFVQAELCLQFHDDQRVRYPTAYHDLRDVLIRHGRLLPTGCPDNFVCNTTATHGAELQRSTPSAETNLTTALLI